MDAVVRGLKDDKVSLSVLVLLIGLAIVSYSWAQEKFVDQQSFTDHTDDINNKLEALSKTVNTHVEEYRITEASRVIRDLKRDIQLGLSINEPDKVIEKLREELQHAEEYKVCLISQRPNCKHLRWPE